MAELHFDRPKNLDFSVPWYHGMKGYHWFVLMVAALGWLFDCLDQQLFVLARPAAMRELLRGIDEDQYAGFATSIKRAAPTSADAAAIDEFLNDVKGRLPDIERRRFWVMAAQAEAQLSSAKDPEAVTAALATARASLSEATDPKVFATTVGAYSGYATAIFLLGWASGGLIFGVLGDRIGRAKTMLITILLYSFFTGLSAISVGFWDFALYRFLTGLGVGGEFAVGVALVAEVMPERARSATLTILQMLSCVGNVGAALISIGMGALQEEQLITSPWRKMFLIGAIPALLAVVIRWKLKEPERWKQLKAEGSVDKQLGSYRALFGNPVWRKHAFIGLALAFSGVVGLWAVGFFTPDLQGRVMRPKIIQMVFDEQIATATQSGDTQRVTELNELRPLWGKNERTPAHLEATQRVVQQGIEGKSTFWGGITAICLQAGAICGMFGFGYVAQRIGRRPTFAIAFITAGLSTAAVFLTLSEFSQVFWMVPLMGFFQLSLFAGYAMYFPELFPTHLRSTGVSFCYNVGRFVAATGPFVQGKLNLAFSGYGEDSLRYAGVTMCSVFLIGLFALPFAPETKGKPLPE